MNVLIRTDIRLSGIVRLDPAGYLWLAFSIFGFGGRGETATLHVPKQGHGTGLSYQVEN